MKYLGNNNTVEELQLYFHSRKREIIPFSLFSTISFTFYVETYKTQGKKKHLLIIDA